MDKNYRVSIEAAKKTDCYKKVAKLSAVWNRNDLGARRRRYVHAKTA